MRKTIPVTTLLLAALFALVSCQGQETRSRSPARQGAETGEASLRIHIPGPEIFTMTSGSASDYLNSYLLRITTDSKKCEDAQRYELKDYIGADTVTFQVKASCSFKIRFAIGKESGSAGLQNGNLALDTFYTTDEPFEVTATDLARGDLTVRLHLKRTALGEKIGFSSPWVKDDLSGQGQNEGEQDEQDNNQNNGQDQTVKIAYSDLKSTIDQSCAGCHRPGGARSQSDLSTYEGFKKFGSNAVARITSGTMPPRPQSPLSSELMKKFTDWQKAGFPEKSSGTSNGDSGGSDQRVIEFRIKSGTGSGAWNSQGAPVTLKVGQVLRIINEDTIRHRLHTDGAPCPHGNDIAPGGSEDCVITRSFTTGNLYDHNNLGRFFIRAER